MDAAAAVSFLPHFLQFGNTRKLFINSKDFLEDLVISTPAMGKKTEKHKKEEENMKMYKDEKRKIRKKGKKKN